MFPACSPDGTRVAAIESQNLVSYWDLALRTRTTMQFGGFSITGVAITSDARHLLVCGIGPMGAGGLYAAFDLSTDPPTRLESALEYDPPGWGLAALPDPELAVAHRILDDGFTRLDVIRATTGQVVRSTPLPVGTLGRFALSPDGTRVATAGNRCGVYDLATGRPVWDDLLPSVCVAFSPDGTKLFGDFNRRRLAARDAATGRALYQLPTASAPLIDRSDHLTGLAVDPGRRFVYAGTYAAASWRSTRTRSRCGRRSTGTSGRSAGCACRATARRCSPPAATGASRCGRSATSCAGDAGRCASGFLPARSPKPTSEHLGL
jgi:WD40 repeat protein